MRTKSRKFGRGAFTLIELLIVMAIIIILTALTVVYILPAFQDKQNVIRGVDRVTQTLLIAKQRALRDQVPRGVRLLVDSSISQPSASPAPLYYCTQMQFIEQPAPFSAGQISGVSPPPVTQATITFSGPVDFFGGSTDPTQYLVQPGDYLEAPVGAPSAVYKIATVVDKQTLQLTAASTAALTFSNTSLPPTYQIYRKPRPIAGEDLVTMPRNVVIDLTQSPQSYERSVGITAVQTDDNGNVTSNADIMFGPQGSLLTGTACGNVILWIRDYTIDDTKASPAYHTSRLVSVGFLTGFIAAHPVSPLPDNYSYTRDGRNSGF
jgi:prepilin-type N-terminal cleavage/methylation domain-containing protein